MTTAPNEATLSSADDTLIFRSSGDSLRLVGGDGRGAGWSGIVELRPADEPLAARASGHARPLRHDGDGEPARVIGPYWARHAVLVPVGTDHLVVFGSDSRLEEPDAAYVSRAAHAVARLQRVAPAKLLADELELVQAIRDLMEYRPERVADTARHIAQMTAAALSCDVGAVLVRRAEDDVVAEVVTRDWPAVLDAAAIRRTLVTLFQRVDRGAVLELELETHADDALGRNQGLVARFALPIGTPAPYGVLVVAHAEVRARGFTNLCQRIGHALADVSASLLAQAISREQLAADRDRFAREARTDPLTGLDNRTAWEEHLLDEETRRARYKRPVSIICADLDNLKSVNDRAGHAAGDRLICAASELLRRQARSADRVARVGGDEFLVLLPETDAAGAERFLTRVREEACCGVADGDVAAELSFGAATAEPDEPLSSVVSRADAAMYAAKRDRSQRD